MQPHVNQALRRLLAIDELLRGGTCPSQFELMERLEVSRRTIQRDFDCLRRHGAPIQYDPVQRGFRYSDADYRLSFLKVSADELVAVFLAQRLLEQYGATPFAQGIACLFRRCLRLMPTELVVEPDQMRACLGVKLAPVVETDAMLFQQLAQACLQRRRLQVLYWTAERDDSTERTLDPYTLLCAGRLAFSGILPSPPQRAHVRGPPHPPLEETGERFSLPTGFNIDDYLAIAFARVRGDGPLQNVRLRFHPRAARYIRERIWHPTQETEELKDGGLRVTFQLASLVEVKAWALSWGRECVVEGPEGLQEEIREELNVMMAAYATRSHGVASTRNRKPGGN